MSASPSFPMTGLILSWLVDLALVMQKRSDEISFGRIKELMPNGYALNFFLHAVRFLQKEFGFAPPQSIASDASRSRPVGFAETLSQRRLRMWGLPAFRGWLRYGGSIVGLYSGVGLPTLRVKDLLRLPAMLWWDEIGRR